MELYKSFLLQWLLLFLLTISSSASSSLNKIPRLSAVLREPDETTPPPPIISDDLKTFFYDQTLDHFNYRPESYATFKQRYVISFKYWGGADAHAPIFAYLGAEASLDYDLTGIGFLAENAPSFKALQVYIEHRYYGQSIPFGSMEEAMKNRSTRGYFNSAQAIADYAEVLVYLKNKFSAKNSPIIVIGASYGGMLASWFRLKYPHIALGALASSAPILYFDDITPQNGYYSIVTKDFKEVSESCYKTIRKSWSQIDKVASKPNGLSILSQRFNTCGQLNKSSELKDYLDTMYAVAAQYNHPPRYPVTVVCGGINGAPKGSDILGRIFAGVVAYRGNKSCHDTNVYPTQTNVGWSWQWLLIEGISHAMIPTFVLLKLMWAGPGNEMVMPIGRGSNDTMFPPSPFNLSEFIDECTRYFGVAPRPHWITTYYGGHDIKLVLNKFASNIIFSNGLRDPYSSAGVLEDISDSVVAVHTVNGSHCLDVLPAKQTDPEWLIMERKIEVEIIQGWIKKYYADLLAQD